MTPEQRVRVTYNAFNERDAQRALAGLASDVRWDDGAGRMLTGKQSVARHWREQWKKAAAEIQIDSMRWKGPKLIVFATLRTQQPNGTSASQAVRNTLHFSDDLISSMQIG